MENSSSIGVLDEVVEGGLTKVKKWLETTDIDFADHDGFTLLMVAANMDKREIVEYLLKRKASVSKTYFL